MIIKLSLFLNIYYVFLVVWVFLCLSCVYHMLKFGFKNATTLVSTSIFVAVAVFMVMTSFTFIEAINWDVGIELFRTFKPGSSPIF